MKIEDASEANGGASPKGEGVFRRRGFLCAGGGSDLVRHIFGKNPDAAVASACGEIFSAILMGIRKFHSALKGKVGTSALLILLAISVVAIPGDVRVLSETGTTDFTMKVVLSGEMLGESTAGLSDFLSRAALTVSYLIHSEVARIPRLEYTGAMRYGFEIEFVFLLMVFAAFPVYLRIRVRKKLKW